MTDQGLDDQAAAVVGRVVDVRRFVKLTSVVVDIGQGALVRFSTSHIPSIYRGDLVAVQSLRDDDQPHDGECRSVRWGPALVLCSARRLGVHREPADEIYILSNQRFRVGQTWIDGRADERSEREMLVVSVLPENPVVPRALLREFATRGDGGLVDA